MQKEMLILLMKRTAKMLGAVMNNPKLTIHERYTASCLLAETNRGIDVIGRDGVK